METRPELTTFVKSIRARSPFHFKSPKIINTMSLNFNFLKSKKVIPAETLQKMKEARIANIKANDLVVQHNVRDNVPANFFKVSTAIFESLGLENRGISISTDEDQIQIFVLDEKHAVKMRGRGDKKKTTMFQYPEVVPFLEKNFGYTGEKMAFKIVKIAEGGTQQIGDKPEDVLTYYGVYTIEPDVLIVSKAKEKEAAANTTGDAEAGKQVDETPVAAAPVASAPVIPTNTLLEKEEEEDDNIPSDEDDDDDEL